MNKQNLILKMAENLGVSRTQKDLAFKIFIDKVTSLLNYGEAIKIPEIGVFQLKKEPAVAGKSGQGASSRIIFSPTYSASTDEKLSLFLTIDVEEHSRVSREYTDKIFSLGIGKPLIPVSNTSKGNVATDELYIQRSIQERINDLLARSEKLESFDLWDDYLSEKTVKNAPTFEPNLSDKITAGLPDEVENFIQKKNFEPEQNGQVTGENEQAEPVVEREEDDIIFEPENLSTETGTDNSGKLENPVEKLIDDEPENTNNEIDEPNEETSSGDIKSEEENLQTDSGTGEATDEDNSKTNNDAEKLNDEETVQPIFDPTVRWTHEQKRDNSFWYILGVFILVTLAGIYYFILEPSGSTNVSIPGDISGNGERQSPVISQEEKNTAEHSTANIPEQANTQKVTKESVTGESPQGAETNPQKNEAGNVNKKPVANQLSVATGQKNLAGNGNNSAFGKEKEVEDLIFYNGKFYSVQISSWKNKSSALKAAEKIKRRGYQTEVVSADLGSRGTWHRVRIAKVKNIKEARRIKNLFVR